MVTQALIIKICLYLSKHEVLYSSSKVDFLLSFVLFVGQQGIGLIKGFDQIQIRDM